MLIVSGDGSRSLSVTQSTAMLSFVAASIIACHSFWSSLLDIPLTFCSRIRVVANDASIGSPYRLLSSGWWLVGIMFYVDVRLCVFSFVWLVVVSVFVCRSCSLRCDSASR